MPFVERRLGHALGLLEGVLLQSQQILYPGVQFLCLDMIRGKHDIKVGGGIRINQMNVRAEGLQD